MMNISHKFYDTNSSQRSLQSQIMSSRISSSIIQGDSDDDDGEKKDKKREIKAARKQRKLKEGMSFTK